MLRPTCDAELADEQYQRQHARTYTNAEFEIDVQDRTAFLEGDDEAMVDAVSDLVTGIITAEERKACKTVGRPIMPHRMREDARARAAIQAVRDLPADNPLKALVMRELYNRAMKDVDRGVGK